MSETVEAKVIKVTESEPIIKKIEIIDAGRGGLRIVFSCMENRSNNMISKIDDNRKHYCPVQKELREAFKSLRVHLLKMTGYYWPNDKVKDLQVSQTVVTHIFLSGTDKFQLGGKRTVLGSFTIPIKGPVLQPDDYELYQEVIDLIHTIKQESNFFIKGLKSADVKTAVTDYLTVKKQITNAEEAYDKMTPEEIEAITREALEDSGLTIIMQNGEAMVSLKEDSFISEETVFEEDADYSNADNDTELPVENDDIEFPVI